MEHKEQPYYGQDGLFEAWQEPSDEMLKGLKLAAYICRMYKDGEAWSEVILSRGEQIRGRFHMMKEARDAER